MILKRFLVMAVLGIVLSFSLLTYLVARKESTLLEKADEQKLWLNLSRPPSSHPCCRANRSS